MIPRDDYDVNANYLKANALPHINDEFEALDKVIVGHSSRIVVVTQELRTLHRHLGSLTADEIVDAVAHDVNVKLTTLEVLSAKRRQLDTEYTLLLNAVTSLKDNLMKLREESYLEEERPTVAMPAVREEFEIAPVDDSAFDADALRRDMEDAVSEGRKQKRSMFRSGK